MHYDMLNKSELKISEIRLNSTNLHAIAECVAEVFGIDCDDVLVIDVRNGEVALDILSDELDPYQFLGKEDELLSKIREIPGVTLSPHSRVTSEGMLGWISFNRPDDEELNASINRASQMADEIIETVSKRVLVFPSGAEVEAGEIKDTNTPMLIEALNAAGYTAHAGTILKDDEDYIVSELRKAIYKGYGIIITTGGVGAEDKDHSVEAVLRLDPSAVAPYIVKFEKGHGRHVKDGIRICVGKAEHVTLITLPGPNTEVKACLPIVLDCLKRGIDKEAFAESIANELRNRLKNKMHHQN